MNDKIKEQKKAAFVTESYLWKQWCLQFICEMTLCHYHWSLPVNLLLHWTRACTTACSVSRSMFCYVKRVHYCKSTSDDALWSTLLQGQTQSSVLSVIHTIRKHLDQWSVNKDHRIHLFFHFWGHQGVSSSDSGWLCSYIWGKGKFISVCKCKAVLWHFSYFLPPPPHYLKPVWFLNMTLFIVEGAKPIGLRYHGHEFGNMLSSTDIMPIHPCTPCLLPLPSNVVAKLESYLFGQSGPLQEGSNRFCLSYLYVPYAQCDWFKWVKLEALQLSISNDEKTPDPWKLWGTSVCAFLVVAVPVVTDRAAVDCTLGCQFVF